MFRKMFAFRSFVSAGLCGFCVVSLPHRYCLLNEKYFFFGSSATVFKSKSKPAEADNNNWELLVMNISIVFKKSFI